MWDRKLLLLASAAGTPQLPQAMQSDGWEVRVTHSLAEAKSLAAQGSITSAS